MQLRFPTLLALLPALLVVSRQLSQPIRAVIGNIPDDAVFYLVIARNLLRDGHFTFDGLNPTTGFHPLWQLLTLVTIAPLGSDASPEALCYAALILHAAVTCLAAVLMGCFLGSMGLSLRWRMAAVCMASVAGLGSYGLAMETPAVLLALFGLAFYLQKTPGTAVGVLIGFALALTRVDLAPFALTAVLLRGRRGWSVVFGALAGIGFIGTFNFLITGSAVSTAAAIKSLGSISGRWERLQMSGVWRYTPVLSRLCGLILLLSLLSREARQAHRKSPILLALCLIGALTLVAQLLLNNLVAPWYHVPLSWLLLSASLLSLSALSEKLQLAGGLVLAGAVLQQAVSLPRAGTHGTAMDFAREIAHHVPKGERIFAEDYTGILALFSDRMITAADGLASSPGYRQALVTGEALSWARKQNTSFYLVTRRRAQWLETEPLVDRIDPPFLSVVPSDVPLQRDRLLTYAVSSENRRLFALFSLE